MQNKNIFVNYVIKISFKLNGLYIVCICIHKKEEYTQIVKKCIMKCDCRKAQKII